MRRLRIAFVVMLAATWACSRPPAGVPRGAVRVAFSKDGGWAYCWVDRADNVNRCRTYNSRGERLYRWGHENDADDVFLRYPGEGLVPESELRIDTSNTGRNLIWLRNGVMLLPRNDFENQRELADKMLALRP